MAYSLKFLLHELEKTFAAFNPDSDFPSDYEMPLWDYFRFCFLLNFFFEKQYKGRFQLLYSIIEDKSYDE